MDVKSIIKLIPGFKPTPKSGTVSTIQKSATAFVKRRKQFKKKKRKSTNDPALTTGLAMTGAASAGLLGKKIMDDRNKPKTIKPKLGLPPKR